MNLPSIFKSSSDMKGKPQQSTPAPKEQPPQDMFGLGIQVFKIDSKKDTMNNSSAGKARKNMKNFQNPVKKSMTPSSQVPKEKKNSGLLPNIYAPQQKEIKVSNVRTDSILSKKKVQKRITSTNKIESIKEVAPKRVIPPANNLKISSQQAATKTEKTAKPPLKHNKTTDKISHNPPKNQPQPEEEEKIIRIGWTNYSADLVNFQIQKDEFEKNKNTKVGRKKIQEYLGEHQSFIQAYVEREEYFYTQADEYEHLGIENFEGGKWNWIQYQNFVME